MGTQPPHLAFVLVMSIVLFPTVTGKIQCFCNSPACPEAVCKSSQQCFVKLLRSLGAGAVDRNASTSIIYGCTETLGRNDCANSSFLICCDTQLCNMPNSLRGETQDKQNTEGRGLTKCPIPGSAMRVASVVAPSLLILTVILLSATVLYKLSHYQRESAAPRQENCDVKNHNYKCQIAGWKPMHGVWKSPHRYVKDVSSATHKVTIDTVNCSVGQFCVHVAPTESV